ncbi:DUF1671-domain-containing protein [Calocera cornea HHB12733]|uniref:DUF1671-domain-containing protein n=1 Tax=Calocera cornea HHB12733 TaxID=1353952 RepID=A0A165F7U9_9BASI|nr:DUF1671-domain-containing protein [Calocera cornea HHB12733]
MGLDDINLTEQEKRFLGIGTSSGTAAVTVNNTVVDLTEDDDESDPEAAQNDIGTSVPCEICREELAFLDISQRQLHYDAHFSDPPGASDAPQSDAAQASAGNRKAISPKENIFWSPSFHNNSFPKCYTPGIVPLVRRALLKSHHAGWTTKAALCQEGVCHIRTEWFDRFWGCGYRNFMMVCTALMNQTVQPSYAKLLRPNGASPGVRQLQHWLEDAWNSGYDKEGAAHFKHHIVGTRKWIGTADIWAVLSFLSVPAQLVDFRKDHDAPAALQDWVKKYFSEEERSRVSTSTSAFDALNQSPVLVTKKLPIILQHAGHSRTIIGYEQDKKGNVNLLLLDPGRNIPEEARRACISEISAPEVAPKASAAGFMQKMIKRVANEDTSTRALKRVKGSGRRAVPGTQRDLVDEKNAGTILSAFRVNLKSLSRKDEYQVLYFPLEPALSAEERERRKVVSSEIGC